MPLVARHARLAARLGYKKIRIVCADDAARAEIDRALAFRPPAKTITLEVTVGEARDVPEGALPALVVYVRGKAGDFAILREVATVADLRAAEADLYLAIKKSVQHDGWVAYYVQRPIARVVTRVLIGTRISPNQVTLSATACGIAAAILAGLGGYWPPAIAGLLFWIGAVIDCVDGELARLRIEGSRSGEWLDTLTDDITTLGIQLGLGFGLARDGAPAFWPALGVTAGVALVFVTSTVYTTLARRGLPIDTAQFPWWWGKPSEEREVSGVIGHVGHVVEMIFRRDAWGTILMFLLAFGLRKPALALVAGGTLFFFVLLIAHLSITSWKKLTT